MTMLIFPYFIPPLLAIIAAFFDSGMTQSVKRNVYHLLTLSGILIYCCVYLNGSDWQNYETFFNRIEMHNIASLSNEYGFEFGYSVLVCCLKVAGFNFMLSLIIMKVFSFVTISHFFYSISNLKYSMGYTKNVFFMLFIFYTFNCIYLYVETIIRFSIALAFIVKSYKYIFKRRLSRFLCLVLCAICFHKSAIVVLPLYWIGKIRLSNKLLFALCSCVILFFNAKLLSFVSMFLFDKFSYLYLFLQIISYTQKAAINDTSNPMSIGNIIFFIFFILVILGRKRIEKSSVYGQRLFAIVIVYFFIYFITMYMGAVSRIRLFYFPSFIIVLSIILSNGYLMRSIVCLCSVLYFSLSMYTTIVERSVFVYYTNYISALIENKADLTTYEKIWINHTWRKDED